MAIIPLDQIVDVKETSNGKGKNVVSLQELIASSPKGMKQWERNLSAADFSPGEGRMQGRNSTMKELLSDPSTMERLQKHPLGTALRTIGGAAELAEGVPASIGLDIQNRNFGKILPHLAEVATGERPAQFGDILSNAGAPEGVSVMVGLLASVGLGTAGKTGQIEKVVSPAVKKIVRYETALQQAEKAKTALDKVRSTIGTAADMAVQQIKDVPTKMQWNIKSEKALNAIKNPIYEVAFDQNGAIVQTVGNLNKVKKAVGELLTPKNWVEAPKTEMRWIKQFYGDVNNEMKSVARSVGKSIDEQMAAYNKFMDNYHLINDKLVDKYDNAMGNKLKGTFKIFAEPAVKEAWKEVGRASPEIKSVMKSMGHRELFKNLLAVGVAAGILEGGKKVISNTVKDAAGTPRN